MPEVRARLEELLDILVNKIVDADAGYGRYYFNADWSVADRNGDSRECEYGLDLEASWLLTEAAERVGRSRDAKIRRASLALVDHALRDGFDEEHGGIYRLGPAAGPAKNKDMEWWQQMEAMVAFLNAYQFTGDPKYWHAFDLETRFVMDRIAWITSTARSTPLSSMTERLTMRRWVRWKAPYHVTRAFLEIISRLGGTL